MKFYDSMGFESEHGIWVRRVDLEARIRELEADAERYRWLRDRAGNGVMKKLEKEARPNKWDVIVDEYRVVEMSDGSANDRPVICSECEWEITQGSHASDCSRRATTDDRGVEHG